MREINGIALVGEPGSGKTSISDALMQILGCERLSFAAPLKNEVAYALDRTMVPRGPGLINWMDHMDRMADPDTKDAYRPLLQAWGSFKRSQYADHWCDKLESDIAPGTFYVIDDCRYFNEYDMLRRHGFVFVYLRSGVTTRPLTYEQAEHESERDWPHFDCDLILDYVPGPVVQARRIVQYFDFALIGKAEAGLQTTDASPSEDDECNCSVDEDGNCDCPGCVEETEVTVTVQHEYYDDDATVLPASSDGDKGVVTIRFPAPYHGEVKFSPPVSRLSIDYADDEQVWAVPA